MKKGIRATAILLLLTVLFSGCDYEAIGDSVRNELAHMLTDPADIVEPFIGFSDREVDNVNLLRQLKPEELENYTSVYSDYNTYTYFACLNDSEKLIYHAYEYALDQGYPYIWFDGRLLENLQWTGFEILYFFALDSAMVEQNLSQTRNGYTVTHSVLNVETSSEAYTSVYVENFEQDRLQRKLEAVEAARKIISQQPEGLTDRQKTEYYFDWLGKNVTYENGIEGEEYLYTALCQGRTNCDGYTNTFAMLCALSDIACIEKSSEDQEGEEGHTWNAVYLEDKWVNVDATGADDDVNSECANRRQERLYFGFPDALQEDKTEYTELIPSCTEGLSPVLNIASGEIEDFNDQVKSAFEENDGKFAVILVDEGDLEDQITEDLATDLGFDLHYTYYETAEGRMVYYLYENDSE